MMMGEFSHSIDDKGRITIPSKLRDDLQLHFIITKGMDGCLFLYPMEEWQKMEEKLKSLPMSNTNARAFARFFLAGAHDVELDKQFRITIPPRLRDFAKIEKDTVLVGVSSRVELWARERWEQYQAESDLNYEEVAEKMMEFGF